MFNNFSVLISIYKNNSIVEIIQLVKSLKAQTLYPNEIIIIYDGPIKNEIKKIIKSLNKLKIIHNKKNLGLGASLNKGVAAAKNNIIVRCDADDINISYRFKVLISEYLKDKTYDVVGSLQEEIYGNKQFIKKIPLKNSAIKKQLILRNCINHPTVLLKKNTVLKSGNFENVGKFIDCNNFEDYFLWLKIKNKGGKFKNIPKILVKSKINKKFFSRRVGQNIKKNYLIFLKKSYNLGFINYGQYITNYLVRITTYNFSNKLFYLIFKIFLR